MKQLLLLVSLGLVSVVYGQDWPLKNEVLNKKKTTPFLQIFPFTFVAEKKLLNRGNYQELKLDKHFITQVFNQSPAALNLQLPVSDQESIQLELVKFDLGTAKFTTNNSGVLERVKIPLTYRGIVTGEGNRNAAMLTVTGNYISLVVTLTGKVLQLTKSDTDPFTYRLYNSNKVDFPEVKLECGTPDNNTGNSNHLKNFQGRELNAPIDKCVQVYVECFDSLFQWRNNSVAETIDYVYDLFNAVSTGYLNEQINIKIQTINVWSSADPFVKINRDTALKTFSANYKDSFWGNIAVGLDFGINGGGRSGLAGQFNGKVKGVAPNTSPAYSAASHPFCYNDLNYNVNVQNFPTGPVVTGPQVYLVMHEMGHLLGSPHTKWCGWQLTSNPATFGALDSCQATEGGCPQGPAPPASGGTIMSYCVTGAGGGGGFVNFNNGFGTLPGNAVRSFVDNTAAIPVCQNCSGDNITNGIRKLEGSVQYISAPVIYTEADRNVKPPGVN